MKQKIKNKVLTAMLTIMACMVGQSARATGAFTVTSETTTNGYLITTTFTITRSGNTSVAETVNWRTVSLSAIEGKHFTGKSNKYTGSLTFAANETTKTVAISEVPQRDVEADYHYQSTDRKYRFEVLDKDGYVMASKDRTISYGDNFKITGDYISNSITDLVYFSGGSVRSGMDSNKYYDVAYDPSSNSDHVMSNGYVKIDDSYAYNDKTMCCVRTKGFFDQVKGTQDYFKKRNHKLYATVYFTEKEEDDGYQYIQILADNVSSKDGSDPNGSVNTPVNSIYKACFEMSKGTDNKPKVITADHYQAFPHKTDSHTSTTEFDYSDSYLYAQAFRSNTPSYRATNSGSLVLDPDLYELVIRFDAAGEGNDTWYFKDLKVRYALCDNTAPSVLDYYKVSGGSHRKGNKIYVSVAFDEIVTTTGTPRLTTNWGTLSYTTGSGTNVLTFSGTIGNNAEGTLSVTGYTGTIKDQAGNQLNTTASTISHDFDITLDADYTWTVSDFNAIEGNTYEIASKSDLRHLALLVNKSKDECEDYTFRQTMDVNCDNTYTPIGYNYGDNDKASFRGIYDGQGKAIRGIIVNKTGTSNTSYIGLFGYVCQGTVKNVVLANSGTSATPGFLGYQYVGGIAGYNERGTIQNCRVESTVAINSASDNSSKHGGIVGYNDHGQIIGCYSAANVSNLIISNIIYGNVYANNSQEYGGIVGYNLEGTIQDCLYLGTEVSAVANNGGIAGYNQGGTLVNNYYTSTGLGGVNGDDVDGARLVRIVNLGENVALSGDETIYDVSGLVVIGTTALCDGATVYSGEEQTVSFMYMGELAEGYKPVFTATAGTMSGNTLVMPAEEVTVTVTADNPITYTVAFDANKGSGEMNTMTFTYDEAQNLSDNEFTRATYTFSGWNTAANGSGNSYGNGESVSNLTAEDGATVTLYAQWDAFDWTGAGTEADPWIILYPSQLDLLAKRVNSGTSYAADDTHPDGYFFMLGDNITYSYADLAEGESNYSAIGFYDKQANAMRYFCGNFNGDNKTVSGIRINKLGKTNEDYYQGIFGLLGEGGVVQNVKLSDAAITAYESAGGIVGQSLGTVHNCTVTSDVVISAVQSQTRYHGGIVGRSHGQVSNCTSSVQMTSADNLTYVSAWGGIVGALFSSGSITDCFVFNANIVAGDDHGAIYGSDYGSNTTISRNYYRNSAVGTATIGIGYGYGEGGYDRIGSAAPIFKLTLGNNIVATGNDLMTFDNETYCPYRSNINLTYNGNVPANSQVYYSYDCNERHTFVGSVFDMPSADILVSAEVESLWGVADGADGTEQHPYIISTPKDLCYLSSEVNSGATYEPDDTHTNGYFFKVVDDLDMSGILFRPIGGTHGTSNYYFKGSFDGNNHVIRNLYVNRPDVRHGGLFGVVNGSRSVVKNIILDGASITANDEVGAIAGEISGKSTVGGATLQNCLVLNSSITAKNDAGIIMGYRIFPSSVSENYYSGCTLTVGGTTSTTGGSHQGDITYNNGAVTAVAIYNNDNAQEEGKKNTDVITENAGEGKNVILYQRTLYKDGDWNTLCLPFSLSSLSGTPLEGATVRTLVSTAFDKGTLTLTFTDALNAIEAGKPYLVKWESGDNLVNPVFNGVTVVDSDPATVPAGGYANFIGTYSPVVFEAGTAHKDVLFLGMNSTLYYPNGTAASNINACRGYFQLNGITAGDLPDQATRFVMNLGNGETTSIQNSPITTQNETGEWYTLDGRRLNGKPTQKGIYINNGKKVAF